MGHIVYSGKLKKCVEQFTPDIICIQETKTDESKVQQFAQSLWPLEYESHWNCC